MDEREDHAHPFGLCNRLFNFIMQSLTSPAFKTVTLGHSNDGTIHPVDVHNRLTGQYSRDNKHLREAFVNAGNTLKGETTLEEVGAERKAKPPKKMVSINDSVEIIDTSKLKYRRRNTGERGSSIGCQEDEPRPLKSILKVRSRSDENDCTIPVEKV